MALIPTTRRIPLTTDELPVSEIEKLLKFMRSHNLRYMEASKDGDLSYFYFYHDTN